MTLLVDSALRSLLLGLLVWALLKLLRVRDTVTESLIWTLVLATALSMPLLTHFLPRLPISLPHLAAPAPAAGRLLRDTPAPAPSLAWLAGHAQLILSALYLAGLAACLGRLGTGLSLSVRLYRHAVPVQAEWARGRRIRASATLKSPASLAHTILLPADFIIWNTVKREAVLAHEAAHLARGDFFVQLAASLHRAVFWFSPFAWWLQSKLAEIAESASDEAAVRRLNDPFLYAEILVDVARCGHTTPLTVAMAKGPLIQQRIDRILCAPATRNLTPPLRALVVAGLSLVALTVASARAAVEAGPQRSAARPAAPVRPAGTTVAPHIRRAVAARRPRHASVARPASDQPAASADDERVSYNPRALLEPAYVAASAYVPASSIVHAGRTFYIRSTERPVADVPIADGN